MNQVKFHSLGLQERDLKFNKGSLHLCTRYVSSCTKKSLKRIRAHDLCDTVAMLLPLSYQANWELVTLWLLERCCQLYTTQLWWDSQVCAGRIPFKPAISIILSITPYSCMRCSCYGQVNFVYLLFFASHASIFKSQLILARFSSLRFHLICLFT